RCYRDWSSDVCSSDLGKYRDRIPLAWAVGLGTVDEMVEEAVRYARAGFPTIKLKIGVDPQRDLEVVREVRAALGPDVPIRVDARSEERRVGRGGGCGG